jgi:hypothetical protein
MADHVRKQVRDAAAEALKGLPTTGQRVYENRLHDLQDSELPALRVFTDSEQIEIAAKGTARERRHILALIIECCSKKSAGMDDELDAMIKEVIVRLDENQDIADVKFLEPRTVDIDMDGEAEKEIGVARITFEVPFYTSQGAPDVAF